MDGGGAPAGSRQAGSRQQAGLGWAAADRSGAAETDPAGRGHSQTRRRDRKAGQTAPTIPSSTVVTASVNSTETPGGPCFHPMCC